MRVILDVLSCWLISDSDISYQNAATSRLSDRAEPGYFRELSCGHRLAVNKSGSYGTTAGQAVLTAKRRHGIRVRPQRSIVNALIYCPLQWTRGDRTAPNFPTMACGRTIPIQLSLPGIGQSSLRNRESIFVATLSHNLASSTRCDSKSSPDSALP